MRSPAVADHRGTRRHRAVLVAAALVGGVVVAPAAAAHAAPPLAGRRSCAQAGAATYTVADGDSWFVIAQHVGVGMRSLLDANDATSRTSLHPGDSICLPPDATLPTSSTGAVCPTAGGTYAVAEGDSWFVIAQHLGVAMRSLLSANDASADTSLHPGDALCLPAGATAPAGGDAVSATTDPATTGRRPLAKGTATLRAFPVQGPCWFGDTWLAPRGNGRRHEGVDLLAKTGQYIYAVTDGILTQRAWDQPGLLAGNAWWLTASDGSGTYYFYGHLSAFATGLKVGSSVVAGQIIGYVGETGSAAAPHLHFEMHPNGGGPVNPYPVVKQLGGCSVDEPYVQPGGWIPA